MSEICQQKITIQLQLLIVDSCFCLNLPGFREVSITQILSGIFTIQTITLGDGKLPMLGAGAHDQIYGGEGVRFPSATRIANY